MDLQTSQFVAVLGLGFATLVLAGIVQYFNLRKPRSQEHAQPSVQASLL